MNLYLKLMQRGKENPAVSGAHIWRATVSVEIKLLMELESQ